MTRRRTLRTLVAAKAGFLVPGAYDGVSAKLVQQAGFPAVYMTGYGTSASRLGLPDLGFAGLAEMADHARSLVAVLDVPLIADADTGYGNALNVRRTVQVYEAAGVAALHIEDQITPKRCGHLDGKEVISLPEMIKKLEAALASRADPNFCIIARTDARGVHGLDDAISRARAFAQLDVDAVFVEAPQSESELEQIPRALPNIPLLVNVFKGGKTPMLPAERLEKMGYRIAIYPSETQRAGIYAMRQALSLLKRKGTTEAMDEALTTFKERDTIVGLDDWQELERKFLSIDSGKN